MSRLRWSGLRGGAVEDSGGVAGDVFVSWLKANGHFGLTELDAGFIANDAGGSR